MPRMGKYCAPLWVTNQQMAEVHTMWMLRKKAKKAVSKKYRLVAMSQDNLRAIYWQECFCGTTTGRGEHPLGGFAPVLRPLGSSKACP